MDRREFIKNTAVAGCGMACGAIITDWFLSKKNNNNNNNIENTFDANTNSHKDQGYGGFTLNLAEHCNLNCKYCDVFAPIAKPEFLDIHDLQKDLIRLNEITHLPLDCVSLMGGEPLLNPKIIDIMLMLKDFYPDIKLIILTNGILLNEMPKKFWKTVRDFDCELNVTMYPLNLDFEKMYKTATNYGINFNFHNINEQKVYNWPDMTLSTTKDTRKKFLNDSQSAFDWSKMSLDLKGRQNYKEKYKNCHHAGIHMIHKGKIFDCYMQSQIKHFNKYFNKNLKAEYLDIYKIDSVEEINKYYTTPMKFCKYCKQCHNTCYGEAPLEWGVSERKITEWT